MALAPVSMGLAYDYSWLTLDNKLTNSFFFSLFEGGSVTTILHVFGKLSKNYYVVSGFEKRKNKIAIQLPQSTVAIISFPGIKLLKLKN